MEQHPQFLPSSLQQGKGETGKAETLSAFIFKCSNQMKSWIQWHTDNVHNYQLLGLPLILQSYLSTLSPEPKGFVLLSWVLKSLFIMHLANSSVISLCRKWHPLHRHSPVEMWLLNLCLDISQRLKCCFSLGNYICSIKSGHPWAQRTDKGHRGQKGNFPWMNLFTLSTANQCIHFS